jgi:arylsulfatase A-like enzyme
MSMKVSRRTFMQSSVAASASALLYRNGQAQEGGTPNILWITSEDNGPELGCYGDQYADTPNIDHLAAKGIIYAKAWSTAPVCAPARTTIISGVYPPCMGAEHMRSQLKMPSSMKMYPQYLRQAGYYCTNNSKEDYNLIKPDGVWDESSNKAHWRKRKPGQPFFAIFNFTTTHESQIRKRPHDAVHDPAKVRVPAYHPDIPEVRQDWAQYYDKITEMDRQVGQVLQELKEDGLEENTIVFYYGDHGSGMPRSKRWPYNSGLQVPMVLYVPDQWKHLAPTEYQPGGKSNRMVGFIDLAPTVLSLAGIQPPDYMQGHAFAGKYETEPQKFLFGFRGRMDERYDMVRSVTDGRYVYIRQYMPHKIYGQHINYMFQTPTTRRWREMYDNGELKPPQTYFWEKKPPEELYDLQNDRDEVNNLANSPQHQDIKKKLKKAQQNLALSIRDIGFMPEDEIHKKAAASSAYEVGHDNTQYPLEKVMNTAEMASMLDEKDTPELIKAMNDADVSVRYWGAMGMLMREATAVTQARSALLARLNDSSPSVQIIAAQALGQYGEDADAQKALDVLVKLAPIDKNGVYLSMLALNAISAMGERAKSAKEAIAAFPARVEGTPGKVSGYVPRLLEEINGNLE